MQSLSCLMKENVILLKNSMQNIKEEYQSMSLSQSEFILKLRNCNQKRS